MNEELGRFLEAFSLPAIEEIITIRPVPRARI